MTVREHGSAADAAAPISADTIAEALGVFPPTDEQRAVIEAPLGPALVVAGAGSGKTETMAARVLWLVANGHVAPEGVLGLTFTRKAAGELAARIRTRLIALGASGLLPPGPDGGPIVDAFTQPTVSTYNSFASSLYRDHAVLIGRDPDGVVLGEAGAWQLARDIVASATDARLADLDLSVDSATEAVLRLAHGLAEHNATVDDLRALIAEVVRVRELPSPDRHVRPDVDRLATTLEATLPLSDLVERFELAKQREGYVAFSDQVTLALQIVRAHAEVAAGIRSRYRVVLLDEYQDTNVAQTWLLAELFGGTPVMAVGDPHQSIYGWRGASAAGLDDFATRFRGADAPDGSAGPPVARYSLSVSWRNGERILDVANALVEPLTTAGGVAVARLDSGPSASAHAVETVFEEQLHEEAAAVAAWLRQRLAEPVAGAEHGAVDEHGHPLRPSAALLLRNRATQPVFLAALREAGVPFHVLGIGGLLEEPEISDLVCALAVLHDPSAGTELVRLLAGPRWRIGVADLHALSRVASWLRDRDLAQRPLAPEVIDALRASVAAGDGVSLVDALDFVATAREDHGQLRRFSEAGRARLREAGRVLAALRGRSSLALPDLVVAVEHELQLDIEVAANPHRVLGDAPRTAFLDALDGYLGLADHATLGGFLSWLREAEWRDNLSPRSEDPEPGTVQVLTIHGAKGLEWDHVAVPRCVEGELPGRPRDGTKGWLRLGVLPYELRGDAAELPALAWRTAGDRKQLLDAVQEFQGHVAAHHEREERRLAYVAVTRARHRLLLSGSWWASQTQPRRPSSFFRPLAERGILPPWPEASEHDENPRPPDDDTAAWWPGDPLGQRRGELEAAAQRVRSVDASRYQDARARPGTDPYGWHADVDLLLAEREERRRRADLVPVPLRVPASAFKDFVGDPGGSAERLRRPVPQRPYRQTRLGTVFHRWVEQRYGLASIADTVDGLQLDVGGERDEGQGEALDDAALTALQRTFESSPWATRPPLDVERELHVPFAGRILVCKIDAMYATTLPDGREGVEIVDWKTGRAPRDDDDRRAKELQLALYRLAYARWSGRALDDVTAAFYFVADHAVLRPASLPDEAELAELWAAALTRP
ncbi:MAG: ATP-dependent DNA helicase [Microcella sp.]|uniref:ATP-dependent DNA helicase n=1 Tax=Microcella sp. TaxID=1913979 RepID=UPI003315AF3A